MQPNFQILLIEPSLDKQLQLQRVLIEEKFYIEKVSTAERGMREAFRKRFDLIICQQKLNEVSGFQVFKKLENTLLQNNCSFFIIMDKLFVEDILIGLEMGIDNFLISPLQKQSVLNKVLNQVKKKEELNFLESKRFMEIFNMSPVPLFLAENQQIVELNITCRNLLGLKHLPHEEICFKDLFDIGRNKQNAVNYRKLENGLIDSCRLENVKINSVADDKFTINQYAIKGSKDGKIIADIIKEDNSTQKNNSDLVCQDFNVCKKIKNNLEYQTKDIRLTHREKEIFDLSAKGLPIKQIATQLNLSERTVEKHRSNIMQKADCHSIFEAIIIIQKDIVIQQLVES